MTPKEYSASEAKRLLDELAPYFAKLERDAVEEMVLVRSWDEESDRKRRCLADRITVIRDVQAQLKSIILVGAQAGRPKYVA
jgi:hypothetical protein